MAFFVKIPVKIEAVCWMGDPQSINEEWFLERFLDGTIYTQQDSAFIKTLEGIMEAKVGDWIIQGVEGEIYPCKPSVFEKTYKKV